MIIQPYNLTGTIDVLRSRLMPQRPAISIRELLELSVPDAHHRFMLESVATIAETQSSYGMGFSLPFPLKPIAGLNATKIDVDFWSSELRFRPRYPILNREGNPAAYDRVEAWLNNHVEVAGEFARVKLVVDQLVNHCGGNTRAIRFFWPSVIALLELAGDGDEASKVRAFAAPRSLPKIPAEIRAMLAPASRSVTAALLLPEASPDPPTQVQVSVNLMTVKFREKGYAISCQ